MMLFSKKLYLIDRPPARLKLQPSQQQKESKKHRIRKLKATEAHGSNGYRLPHAFV